VASGSHPRADHKNRPVAATLEASGAEIPNLKTGGANNRPASQVMAWLKRSSESAAPDAGFEQYWEEQGLLWCAFALAAGIAVYGVLPTEPSLFGVLIVAGSAAAYLLHALRHRSLGWKAALMLACVIGFAVAAVRSAGVEAPRLGEDMNVTLTGTVLERQATARQARLVVSVASVNGWQVTGRGFPQKVRMRVPADSDGAVGDHVRLRGRLFPPPGPVHPGGYDFSFRAYFDRIGATGFSYGPAELLAPVDNSPAMRAAALVAKLRTGLADQIRSVLKAGPESALIVAVLVGDRSGIAEEQEESLRAAGLAHILAISGLHMALFAGGTYGGVLLLLALIPSLALRWPTHKWAALAALLAAVFYLLLSGAGVATQRSFLMIALVFLGILTGRRGLTLRSVALAGFVLLLFAPERLFLPGFQMSFAAVICLVAVYDIWRRRERGLDVRPDSQGWKAGVFRFVGRWAAGLFVTALVAGLATGIVGVHHFGRVAPFGLIGNMLGMPVFTLLVMPMGVLSLVLMPLGLAALPLTVMSYGVSILLRIAEFTAGLDAGTGTVGTLEAAPALLLVSALFAALLLPGRLRLLALVPLAVGTVFVSLSRPPDIQVPSSGSRLAARDIDGMLRYAGRTNSFLTELWSQREGVSRRETGSRKMISPQRRCDRQGCVVKAYPRTTSPAATPELAVPIVLALPKALDALALDCRYADIVVSDLVVGGDCGAGLVLDRKIRKERGAISLWLSDRPPEPELPDKGRTGEELPAADQAAWRKPEIERIVYAIPDPPRPWHAAGHVTRQSLRRAVRAEGE